MNCIFCSSTEKLHTIEHIVPESLGNKKYTLTKGAICQDCNNRFSKFEDKALSQTVLGMERARLAVKTKKDKPASSKIGNIQIRGSEDFEKNLINLKGVKSAVVTNVDSKTGALTLQIRVPGFDKSEVATSKLLLKIGFEALYQSRRKFFKNYNFSDLTDYLTTKTNDDWPFITIKNDTYKYQKILKHDIKNIRYLIKQSCMLRIREVDKDTLLFKFEYGGFKAVINLINRDLKWMEDYYNYGLAGGIYPERFEKELNKNVC